MARSLFTFILCVFLTTSAFAETSRALEIDEIADAYENTAVRIEVTAKGGNSPLEIIFGKPRWSGSGFFISKNQVLTNSHVALDDSELEDIDSIRKWMNRLEKNRTYEYRIVFKNKIYYAKPLGYNTLIDVAALEVINPPDDVVPAPLGDSDKLKVGKRVVAIGSPLGLKNTVTTGIVSALHRRVEIGLFPLEDSIQTDAAIAPGSSGSPLINMAGEVVGINNAGVRGVGIGFTIPINLVKEYLPRMLAGEKIRSGKHGLTIYKESRERTDNIEDLQDLSEVLDMKDVAVLQRIDTYLKENGGALVESVDSNSLAHGSFGSGDIVVSFDNASIKNGFDLMARLARSETGKEYEVVVLRMVNGQQKLTLKLRIETTSTYFKRIISSQY